MIKSIIIVLAVAAVCFGQTYVDGKFNVLEYSTLQPVELTVDFPATSVNDIDFDFGLTGLGLVPYVAFDTAYVDTARVYLQFRAPTAYETSLATIKYEWAMADTMLPGDSLAFQVIHAQADPGSAFNVYVDTVATYIVAADTLLPGYHESAYLPIDTIRAYSSNLVIRRPVADDFAGIIGILGWTVKIPLAE